MKEEYQAQVESLNSEILRLDQEKAKDLAKPTADRSKIEAQFKKR